MHGSPCGAAPDEKGGYVHNVVHGCEVAFRTVQLPLALRSYFTRPPIRARTRIGHGWLSSDEIAGAADSHVELEDPTDLSWNASLALDSFDTATREVDLFPMCCLWPMAVALRDDIIIQSG